MHWLRLPVHAFVSAPHRRSFLTNALRAFQNLSRRTYLICLGPLSLSLLRARPES